jgi:hypothetical protein
MGAQPVPEGHLACDLVRIGREDVEVDVVLVAQVRAPDELAVLLPPGLPDPQHVPRRLESRDVGGLVGRVGDHGDDVDDRLRRQAGHRRRPRVFEAQDACPQGSADAIRLLAEALRPDRVVPGKGYESVDGDRLADGRCPDLLLTQG